MDAIQQTLQVMELINPFKNTYVKKPSARIKDRAYFLSRDLSGAVERYSGFGYNKRNIWYDRLDSVENLAKKGLPEESFYLTIQELSQIAINDEDWRIQKLCAEMLLSIKKNGNFSDTYPFQEKIAEEKRMTIQISSKIGYDPKARWYDRLDAVENLAKKYSKKRPTQKTLNDLRLISTKDDNWRIREVAENLLFGLPMNL